MEFTYDGFVRCGFGFYNPNHAAAFICALLPFAFSAAMGGGATRRISGAVAAFALFAALVFTYSRAGLLVAFLEAAAFAFRFEMRHWKAYLSVFCAMCALVFASGLSGRLAFDASAMNRLEIWRAGLALFAANPLGVGLGNSGEIASAFILPDGVRVRTLVNAHLTLTCEFGIFAGALWLCAIFYAICKGAADARESGAKFSALVAFSGLAISAALSSIFDWEPLFYPSKFGYLSGANIFCQALNPALFFALLAHLAWGRPSARIFAFSFGAVAAVLCLALILPAGAAPKVRKIGGEIFVSDAREIPDKAAFFDDSWSAENAAAALKKLGLSGALVALRSAQNLEELPKMEGVKTVVLFGACADFAGEGSVECVLVSPPPHFDFAGKNIGEICLPKWDGRYENIRRNFPNGKIKNL